jgi:hypothetical protein
MIPDDGDPMRSALMSSTVRQSGYRLGAVLALAAAVLALDGAGSEGRAAGVAPFLAHQAAYDLSLKTARRSPIEAAEGRIVYSFSGSECEGYTTDFRQVSRLNAGEGRMVMSDLRSTSWEEGKGASYRFKIETRMNEENKSSVDGSAERTKDGIVVKLKQPQAKTFTIDKDIVFPTEQVNRIIEAARACRRSRTSAPRTRRSRA